MREVAKLCREKPRLQCIETAVEAFDVVIILLRLAVITKHLDGAGYRFIVRGHSAGFAARSKILARIEAERSGITNTSRLVPSTGCLGIVLGAVRLARILNDNQVVLATEFKNWIHIGHLPVKVNGYDGRYRRLHLSMHELAGFCVHRALLLKILRKLSWVHAICALVDINEVGARSGLADRLGRGDEGV